MKWHQRITMGVGLLLCSAMIGFVLAPLVHRGFFISDDGSWMIIRLSAFFQSFREGQFPVRFLGRLNYNYGYPVANFLYPGFLYLGSLIHATGFSFVDTVKIIFGGSVIIGAVFTYLWLRTYFASFPSLIGTAGFALSPYLVFDLYSRGSVGEILAIAWAAMGLYSIAAKKPWLLGLAVSLLIVSHNTLAVLFLAFYAVYITVLGAWRDFWFMYVLGVGMVSFFWIPALHERKYVIFDTVAVADPVQYFMTVKNWFLIGISGSITAVVSVVSGKRFLREKYIFLLTFLVCLVMVIPISAWIWHWQILSRTVQFPYRFLSVTVLLGAWFIAYISDGLSFSVRWILPCLLLGISCVGSYQIIRSIQYVNFPEGYYATNEATTTVRNEYMPRWVMDIPTQHAYDKLIFVKGAGTFDGASVSSQYVNVMVHATQDSIVQINTIYYPGWGVTIDDAPVVIDYKNNQGVMRIAVPKGTHHLVAGFRETISRFLADCVSLGCLVWYILIASMRKRRI